MSEQSVSQSDTSALDRLTLARVVSSLGACTDEMVADLPKAKNYKPENFVDSSIMKQLDQNGFIASVYR